MPGELNIVNDFDVDCLLGSLAAAGYRGVISRMDNASALHECIINYAGTDVPVMLERQHRL